MATSNPRITITLQPAVHAVLKRISELTGTSQSAFVGELLENSMPVFGRMVTVLTMANEAQGKAKEDVRAGLETAQETIEQQLGLLLEQSELPSELIGEAERIRRRRSAGGVAPRSASRGTSESERGASSAGEPAPGAARTPMSNRGVTPHPGRAKVKNTITSKGRRDGQV